MVNRFTDWLAGHPLVSSFSALATACLLARPWGNFPLNDDWQYALVARRFAETGKLIIDVPVAPALVGQMLLALPVIRLFGFSHSLLRVLTLAMSILLLFAVDRLLRAAAVSSKIRSYALVLLALSPFFFYLAATFMTEMYGLAPALLAAAIWFGSGRRPGSLLARDQVVTWRAAIAAALLCGFAFWTRQFAALVLPALIGASVLSALAARDSSRLSRLFIRSAASLAVFFGCVYLHAVWARATGNEPAQQQLVFDQIFKIDRGLWTMQPGIVLVYMTAFSLPLLLLFKRSGSTRLSSLLGAVSALALVAIAIAAHQVLQHAGITPFGVRSLRHSAFPYIGEALINAGLGPITFSDWFWSDLPSPGAWPAKVWNAIELLLIAATVSWVPVASALWRAIRERPRAAEVAIFGVLFSLASFVAAVLVEQPWIHDRYYFPCALGLGISLAALVDLCSVSRARRIGSALAAIALALFTIGGVHDEFRWNESRWNLVERALASGANPLTIDGGYEVDGWLHRMQPEGARPAGCNGPCRCSHAAWECLDDTNRIGLSIAPGYELVEMQRRPAWLGESLSVIWSRRK